MSYRVYSGPRGSGEPSPFDKRRALYKELATLDEAIAWSRHLQDSGRVPLRIEGDDGTMLTKFDIAAALRHPERVARVRTTAS